MSQALSDGGAVLGCGTGIENCDAEGMTVEVARVARAVRARLSPPSARALQMKTDCGLGKPVLGDTRAGACAREAAVWQSMIVVADANGALVWQRVVRFAYRDALTSA